MRYLCDDRSGWRPDSFGYELWGCKVGISFPIVKVLDYIDRWEKLEKSDNPFTVIVMAHLKTQDTRHNEIYDPSILKILHRKAVKNKSP